MRPTITTMKLPGRRNRIGTLIERVAIGNKVIMVE